MSNIFYISPFRADKNFGLGINQAIHNLHTNEDDWIVLTDYDTLWPLPESKATLIRILEQTHFDILGAVTNRLSMPNQLIPGTYDEWNIQQHVKWAKLILDDHGTNVRQVYEILAAFCLCFKVSVWRDMGGFCENNMQFDIIFCMEALRLKKKMGIMEGVYVFHLYRPLSDNAPYDIKHLQ